ncbi:four helix bundle protein [Sediminibacterium sp.]|uniref:four helix bundle protein n=1 Tax=Sediminibacterium sp. TaxID=1917865 RepID=UPI0025FAF308|nr:four helix bundle protein [Sediminibacterium sp.]MBW0178348.1 four helix bundle protein [Sediminibacterium sp.]
MPFKFEKLIVWQKSLQLIEKVNVLVKQFPKEELFVLTSQIKRAADSVSLNIAEGSTGQSNPEFLRFLNFAIRSNIEVVACLHIARIRGLIKQADFEDIYTLCDEMLAMLNALKQKLK